MEVRRLIGIIAAGFLLPWVCYAQLKSATEELPIFRAPFTLKLRVDNERYYEQTFDSLQLVLVRAGVHVAAMEDFADFDAATQEIFAGSLNVGNSQVQSLSSARRCRGDVLSKDRRAPGTSRRELDSTPLIAGREIAVG